MTDPMLHRAMSRLQVQTPQAGENFWVTYWLNQFDQSVQSRQSIGHLAAYLQETCFWAVSRIVPRLNTQRMSLSDCFQVAIADVARLVSAFDSSKAAGLKTYANTVFGNTLRDHLRQQREVDYCSDWGLLLKISRKRLLEALTAVGFDEMQRSQRLLAWRCFTENYIPQQSPKVRNMTAPSPEIWQTILVQYERETRSLKFTENPTITAKTLEKWLLDCAKQVRQYLYPNVSSLNRKKADGDGGDRAGEWQDDLSAEAATPMEAMLEQETQTERQQQKQGMVTVLEQAIAQLDPAAQNLLRSYYQEHLTQQQMAQQANVPQYTISRQLTRIRTTLLKALVQWAESQLHISPTSDVMSSISALLEEWLESFYGPESFSIKGGRES